MCDGDELSQRLWFGCQHLKQLAVVLAAGRYRHAVCTVSCFLS
jgi:hypothetical protein